MELHFVSHLDNLNILPQLLFKYLLSVMTDKNILTKQNKTKTSVNFEDKVLCSAQDQAGWKMGASASHTSVRPGAGGLGLTTDCVGGRTRWERGSRRRSHGQFSQGGSGGSSLESGLPRKRQKNGLTSLGRTGRPTNGSGDYGGTEDTGQPLEGRGAANVDKRLLMSLLQGGRAPAPLRERGQDTGAGTLARMDLLTDSNWANRLTVRGLEGDSQQLEHRHREGKAGEDARVDRGGQAGEDWTPESVEEVLADSDKRPASTRGEGLPGVGLTVPPVGAEEIDEFLARCRADAGSEVMERESGTRLAQVGGRPWLLQDPVGGETQQDLHVGDHLTTSNTRLRLVQLNMQHAKLPTYELFPRISTDMLACLQEPWTVKGQVRGMLPHLRATYGADPRAMVLAHKDLNATALPQFTTSLMATVILHTNHPVAAYKRILISSWYWPPTGPYPPEFDRLVEFIRGSPIEFVIMGDMNAHSTWWGHRATGC